MKNTIFKYLTFALFLSLVVTACNDFEDENYDFSNAAAAYVEFPSQDTLTAIAGETVAITARVRVAIQSVVTASYEISGDFIQTGTIEIPAGMVSGSAMITLPAIQDVSVATVRLTAVDNGLALGRGEVGDGLSALEFPIKWTP